MKQKIVLFFLLFSIKIIAQETKNHVLKVNISSFALGGYGLGYEQIFGKRLSLNLGLGFKPKKIVPYANAFGKMVDFADNRISYLSFERLKKDETLIGAMSFTPELRLYLGKKPAPIGFYLAIFGRYNSFPTNVSASLDLEYKTRLVTVTLPVDTEIKTYSGGLMFGKQFQLGSRFTLDWVIFGGHIGKFTTNAASEQDLAGFDDDFRNRLKAKIIDSFKINTEYLGVDVDKNGVKIQNLQQLKYLNLRGFGLNLGYRF